MQNPTDLAEAQRLWNKCWGDHCGKRIVDYRDKYVAHYGEPHSAPPAYRELFGFARATASALEKPAPAGASKVFILEWSLCGFVGGSLCASTGHSLSTTARISSEMTETFFDLCNRRRSAALDRE